MTHHTGQQTGKLRQTPQRPSQSLPTSGDVVVGPTAAPCFPGGSLCYCTCAQEAISTMHRKKLCSSVAYKWPIGTPPHIEE